jgi:hypothetical protein
MTEKETLMKRNLTTLPLVFAITLLAAAACQKAPQAPVTTSATSTTSALAATGAESTPPTAPTPPAVPARVKVCTLLSAAEVGALMGKTLIQNGCSYGLDPAEKEKAMAKSQEELSQATNHAAAGDLNGFMKGMMKVGAGQQKTGSTMMDQMDVSVDASRDDQTEAEIKSIYAKTGGVVHGALAGPLAPEKHGLNGVIEGFDEVSNVGDWAFATNVASVNMGMGFSMRGRILEARKGPWHVTVSATVGPDPGAAALDGRLASVARALIAKL